ncbi:MAG: hypothetical protein QXX95_03020 [Nitrososphaerales archaeon]
MRDEIISVIDKDIEIAEGLYSKDIPLPLLLFVLFFLLTKDISLSIIVAGGIFILLQQGKKKLRTIERVYSSIRYTLRPAKYIKRA